MKLSPFENGYEACLVDECDKLAKILLGSHALAKACSDPFDYALKLRTGEVIRFVEARIISSGWIHLDVMPPDDCQPVGSNLPYPADRGVDVRIADIVWAMDAPEGS
jgi:hypothetical protein